MRIRDLPLTLVPLLLILTGCVSCASLSNGLHNALSPEECARRLEQSQTLEDALKVLQSGGLAAGPAAVIIQAIIDGRTTLEIACQIANNPAAVQHMNSLPTTVPSPPAPPVVQPPGI